MNYINIVIMMSNKSTPIQLAQSIALIIVSFVIAHFVGCAIIALWETARVTSLMLLSLVAVSVSRGYEERRKQAVYAAPKTSVLRSNRHPFGTLKTHTKTQQIRNF